MGKDVRKRNMLGQDIITIGTLVVLEGLLSADNALVLAVLVKHLPDQSRKRALRYGILGAFLFRLIALLLVSWLIHVWYFKAVGAAYLIFISARHFQTLRKSFKSEEKAIKKFGFWKTVLVVELTDIAFSVDSILAAVALSNKLWIVYLGGILGIIAMRFVAGGFLKLLDKFPGLENGAYLLVGWIGIKLAIITCQEEIAGFPHVMTPPLFWSVMAIILVGSMLWKGKQHAKRDIPPDLQ